MQKIAQLYQYYCIIAQFPPICRYFNLSYKRIHSTPPLPSLTIFVIVRRIFVLASSGISLIFTESPSAIRSFRVLPKTFVLKSAPLSFSYLSSISSINRPLCCSVPIIGLTSVLTSTFIRCRLGALALIFMPYYPPCLNISGSSTTISSFVGDTTP